MMKKILLFIIMFPFLSTFADDCDIICPSDGLKRFEKETFFNNVSGINFFSKKIVETIIQNELKDELNSNFKANLDLFNIKRLKSGEFKSLGLNSKNIKYKALSLSEFSAQTVCDYNKVIYENRRIKYPMDIPLKFKAEITNEDIQNIINSEEFQKEIKRNQTSLYSLSSPEVEIKDSKVYLSVPIKTLFGSLKLKLTSGIEVKNNKLVLTNTTFKSKSNIINESMISMLTEKINPMEYLTSALNGKYFKVYINQAVTESDRIRIEGIFTINKNYGGNNE